LHAEEVGVETGREEGLVYGDFYGKGEDVRGVVEVVGEEEEPARIR
jgi:hypothetical protein